MAAIIKQKHKKRKKQTAHIDRTHP